MPVTDVVASTAAAELADFADNAVRVPTIRIYQDPSGGNWFRTYTRVSEGTMAGLSTLEEQRRLRIEREAVPAEDLRAAEMAWLQSHSQELAEHYPGEWIAVDGQELVAHAHSLVDLYRMAAESGHPEPFVTAVPARPGTAYYL